MIVPKETSKVTITTIIDNYVDILLPSSDKVERTPLIKGNTRMPPLLAEHGFSVLVEVVGYSYNHTILMDFGASQIGVPHNLKVLEIDIDKIEAFVISHGHHDHVGAIVEVLSALSKKPRAVVVHPHAFISTRFRKLPDGRKIPTPCLSKGTIEETGNIVIDGRSSVPLASDYIFVLGEIPRITDFEKGTGTTFYEDQGEIISDLIMDDKGIVLNIRNKGLVVLTGCAHAGIINTVRFAQETTGIKKIYCVMGGFHLAGPLGASIIEGTIKEMKKFNPEIIVPCHCTGMKAIQEFEKNFPTEFVLNSVGTKIHL